MPLYFFAKNKIWYAHVWFFFLFSNTIPKIYQIYNELLNMMIYLVLLYKKKSISCSNKLNITLHYQNQLLWHFNQYLISNNISHWHRVINYRIFSAIGFTTDQIGSCFKDKETGTFRIYSIYFWDIAKYEKKSEFSLFEYTFL